MSYRVVYTEQFHAALDARLSGHDLVFYHVDEERIAVQILGFRHSRRQQAYGGRVAVVNDMIAPGGHLQRRARLSER